MKKIIAFDMDGTIVDLYGVADWLHKLQTEDVSPYVEAKPLVDMKKLNDTCNLLRQAGWEIQVITAMAKNAAPEYKEAIKAAKIAWLKKWGFIVDHFHGIDYTTPKKDIIKKEMKHGGTAILIDDEERHTSQWDLGDTIDPITENIVEALYQLLYK